MTETLVPGREQTLQLIGLKVVRRRLAPAVVEIAGELDLANAHELAQALGAAVAPGRALTLGLHGLTFMDCRGVAVLEALAIRQAPARVRLVGPSATILRLLSLTGTDNRVDTVIFAG